MLRKLLNSRLAGPSKGLVSRLLANPGHKKFMKASEYVGEPPPYVDMNSRLNTVFWNNKRRMAHKWHHYIDIYERYFSRFVGKPVTFLEIGVWRGGSIDVWRQYFGDEARLFGIDIDPRCARFDGDSGSIRIGSQADPGFIERIAEETGPLDVVLDDGSHQMEHVRASFDLLFPRLKDGGLYVVEDMQCAYWDGFGGGYGAETSFIEFGKRIVDDLHAAYHGRPLREQVSKDVSAVHFHDAIVVIEKGSRLPPRHSQIGGVKAWE